MIDSTVSPSVTRAREGGRFGGSHKQMQQPKRLGLTVSPSSAAVWFYSAESCVSF